MLKFIVLLIVTFFTLSCSQNRNKQNKSDLSENKSMLDSTNIKTNAIADSLVDLESYIVSTEKSYFFNSPDSQSKRKDFLSNGKFVQIDKINNGFGSVVHPMPSETDVYGWILLNTLERIRFTPPKNVIIDSSEE